MNLGVASEWSNDPRDACATFPMILIARFPWKVTYHHLAWLRTKIMDENRESNHIVPKTRWKHHHLSPSRAVRCNQSQGLALHHAQLSWLSHPMEDLDQSRIVGQTHTNILNHRPPPKKLRVRKLNSKCWNSSKRRSSMLSSGGLCMTANEYKYMIA